LESLCELERFAKIIAAGFFVFTKAEKRLMQKVFKKKQTLFIFHNGPGVKRSIEKLGGSIQYGEGRTEPNPQRPKYHFIKSPDTHGQVSALNHALQYLLAQKKLDEKTFIMLPAPETLFPLINHTLPTIGEGKYNISLGFPLKRTPVFGFFANLMEVISSFDRGRVYVPHYLKFILHPYTKNIYFEKSPEVTRIMFHELELLLTKNRSKLFIDLTDIEQMNLPAFDEASSEGEAVISKKIAAHLQTIHKNTICMFTNIKNTGDFAEKGVRLISYIYKQSTAILHPFFHPFAENFIEALTTISRSMAKEIVFDSCLGYFHFVKNYLNTVHTPFEGVPLKGVQIVGFLETRNLQPERIFVVDLNEGVLPEKRGENSLIPFKVRKYLGIPTYSDHEKISSYYFETLTKGTKEVFLYFIENKKKEKSRFVEKLLWEEEKREKGIRGQGGSLVEGVQYSLSLETEKRDPVQKSDEMISYLNDFTFSATSLDVYLRCPLRFYYQYVLNVREREEAPELIEASQVGLFVHKALQVLFEKKLGIPLTKDHFTAFEIETTVDRLFAKQFSPEITGTLYILKKQITRQLKNFFKNYQIPRILTTSTIVTDVEMRLQSRYQGYLTKGTIDRVERQGEELTIIDYKSSSN
ncbi:MAG: PD-(D/E)XK nuclease family protein, partial [Nitrospinota bacterium]